MTGMVERIAWHPVICLAHHRAISITLCQGSRETEPIGYADTEKETYSKELAYTRGWKTLHSRATG